MTIKIQIREHGISHQPLQYTLPSATKREELEIGTVSDALFR